MAVRNFWVDANIDGRQTMLSGGPRSRDGGMNVDIYIRDEGSIASGVKIRCWEFDGTLKMSVHDETGRQIYYKETRR